MRRLSLMPCLTGLILVLCQPQAALALISHGHPEGLYVHQIAHLLFAGALIFLVYRVHKEGLQKKSGFRLLTWSCVWLVLWNLDAFVGHWAEVLLSAQDFIGQAREFSQRLLMSGPVAWVYYLTKLDHLLLVPGFYLLYRGLKTLEHLPPEAGP
ncbi:MAG: hypothetical protein ACOZFS_14760 [Thermodesulfobacteriota bacterium]